MISLSALLLLVGSALFAASLLQHFRVVSRGLPLKSVVAGQKPKAAKPQRRFAR